MYEKDPVISVIMGIYNCGDTLSEAIECIVNQTFSDWELIMCDDGSNDDTYEIAISYKEKYPEKIIVLQNEKNRGLNYTLNKCLKQAKGKYIARMDGDDVSVENRLFKEISFLENNPEYAIVSSPMIYFDENGEWGESKAIENPTNLDFVTGTPFCHAPCMVRTEAYKAVNGYSTDKRTLRAEDYDLWFRLYALGYKGYNIQTPLYKMRDDAKAYSRRKFKYAKNEAYVRLTGYKSLDLPTKYYLYALRPIIVGLLPKQVYMFLHHRRKG